MRFHVVGLGAVGTLIANHLRRSLPEGHSVSLIHKNVNRARQALWHNSVTLEENGLPIVLRNFPHGTADVDVVSATAKLPNITSDSRYIESIFVTLKAHHTLPAIRRIAARLSPNSTIVLLQNGMGVYERLVQEVFINPKQRPHFILASNTHGVYSKGLLDVVHTGRGEIRFGIVPDPEGRNYEAALHDLSKPFEDRRGILTDITQSENLDPMFSRYRSLRNTVAALQLMDSLNPTWLTMEEMQIAMRRKLAVNAVINPLTALVGCKNGDVFQTTESRSLMFRICKEASDIFKAEMVAEARNFLKTTDTEESSDVLLDRLPEALTRDSLMQECLRVAEATKNNISSMLADIRSGTSSGTEIDYINGHLIALGQMHNVQVPVNTTLTRLVRMKSRFVSGESVLL
ncbi:ketopantoate reductase-like protein [Lentinula aciculospora]|uniref:2-dehydropantoate 2-reductase n=1 Tax=Lentinula aciculospora TaxID=153920 RepID=A0A9W9DTH7_9AGAR|nr:ketopantoate reductase-like protein [Lentinula aciculospora]